MKSLDRNACSLYRMYKKYARWMDRIENLPMIVICKIDNRKRAIDGHGAFLIDPSL